LIKRKESLEYRVGPGEGEEKEKRARVGSVSDVLHWSPETHTQSEYFSEHNREKGSGQGGENNREEAPSKNTEIFSGVQTPEKSNDGDKCRKKHASKKQTLELLESLEPAPSEKIVVVKKTKSKRLSQNFT